MERYQIHQERHKGSGKNRPVIRAARYFIGPSTKEAHCKYSKTGERMELQSSAESQFMVIPKPRGTKWAAHLLHLPVIFK